MAPRPPPFPPSSIPWPQAVQAAAPAGDGAFLKDAGRIRGAIELDGEVADCNASLPARYLRHAWSSVQHDKARAAHERIDALVLRLGNILRADYARSEAALAQPALQASFGPAHHRMFDFEAMSKLLAHSGPRGGLGERRRRRIEDALSVLKSQRFFAPTAGGTALGFEFETTDAALAAFRERLPELARLLKALQVAQLEIEGSYSEALHDAVFGAFGERSVTPQDLEFFPDYLVCIEAGEAGAGQRRSVRCPPRVRAQRLSSTREPAGGSMDSGRRPQDNVGLERYRAVRDPFG